MKRYFHKVAKDANERLNMFVNEFISHVTRSGCKIARDDGRKTLLDRDIDDVFFHHLRIKRISGSIEH